MTRVQLHRIAMAIPFLFVALALCGGAPMLALAEEAGENNAELPNELWSLSGIPQGAPEPSLAALLAQAETSVEVVVNTEEELLAAAAEANEGAVIALGDDIVLKEKALMVQPGQRFTLDLKGYTLSRGLDEPDYRGWVIYVGSKASLTISNLNIFQGSITGGKVWGIGGGIHNLGTLTMTGGKISGNYAYQDGGGVANYGTAHFNGTSISGNTAERRGGGIFNASDATLVFEGGSITNNASEQGGGVFNTRSGGSCALVGCNITTNRANEGGGIFDTALPNAPNMEASKLILSKVNLYKNTAVGRGGGLYARVSLFDEEDEMAPIAINIASKITYNEAGAEGGGIYLGESCEMAITNATVTNNVSSTDGAGMYVDGSDIWNLSMEDYVLVKDNKLKKEIDGKKVTIGASNVCFASPDNVIRITGPFDKSSSIYVTFDPSLLYRTVTKFYSNHVTNTSADGNEDVIDPKNFFHGDGNQVAILKHDEVRITTRLPYVDEKNVPHEIIDYDKVTSSLTNTKSETGWWVVPPKDVTLDKRPVFSTEERLLVLDGATLTCSKGIDVPKGGSLIIYGQEGQSGKLVADARSVSAAAGIGSRDSQEAGKITINGANIYAYGGEEGAGIGCGGNFPPYGQDDNNSDPFTLNRGYVEATGGAKGAGVGHGLPNFSYSGYSRIIAKWSSNFDIYVHGGTLIANGGTDGPGIGTSNVAGFTLTVDGGEVVATGGMRGAGIGSASGYYCYDKSNLTFVGGKVTATGGTNMPGIGCRGLDTSYYADGSSDITFSGGTVEYTRGSGSPKPLDGVYETDSTVDTMVLAGESANDAKRVLANERWDALKDEQYTYVRVEPCDHYEAEEVYDGRSLWELHCPWCQSDSLPRGWLIHYEPGEGTGEMAHSFVKYAPGAGAEFTLPTTTTFVPPQGKVLSGWKIGNTVYGPGATVRTNKSVTAVAQWKMTWAGVQAFLKSAEAGNERLVLVDDLVATESDRALTVPAGRSVELDLNGHTINRNLSNPTPWGSAIRVEGNLVVSGEGVITGGYNSSAGDDGGGGVSVAKGANFTIRDATISGNKAAGGAGVYTQGDVLFESGAISHNVIDGTSLWGSGGGVMVDGGTFTMHAGADITNNASSDDGGGVMLLAGTFLLEGGTITDNAAGTAGGGVFVGSQSNIRLIGQLSIISNVVGEDANNVWLEDAEQSPLLVSRLGSQAKVGVTTTQEPLEGAPVVFTSGLQNKDLNSCFTSDNPDYVVDLNEKSEAILGLPVIVSFDAGEVGTGEMAPVTKASGSIYEVPACAFRAKNGQEFLRWQLGDNRVAYPDESIDVTESITLTAVWEEGYAVWLGNTQITKDNVDDVLGDGTACFDPNTNTLTLNDFAGVASNEGPVIRSSGVDLTVTGSGRIALKNGTASYGIDVQGGSLSIGGDLSIEAKQVSIHAEGDVTFTHGTMQVSTSQEEGRGVYLPSPGTSITVASNIELLEVSTHGRAFHTADDLAVHVEEGLIVEEPEDKSLAGEHVLIVREKNPVIVTVTAREGLIYDGSEQELVNYQVDGGTILFKLSEEGTFGEAATAKNAGTYHVYYKVKGDADHNNLATQGPIEVTIAKAASEVTVTVTEPVNETLDVSAVNLQKEGGPDGTVTLDEAELSYGTNTYHWTFVPDDVTNYEVATGTVEITAITHAWNEPTYEWSPGYVTVTAKRVHKEYPDLVETEVAPITWGTSKQPTCTEWGQTTYTATFKNPAFETQYRTNTNIRPTGHDPSDEPVVVPQVDPKCTRYGYGEERIMCKKCGKVVSSRNVRIDMLGHDWQVVETTTGDVVHVKKTCARCGEVEEYDYEKDHEHELEVVEAVEPSCLEPGTRQHYVCVGCQKLFEDAAGEVELQPSDVTIPALDHDWAEPTYEWSENNDSVVATRTCTRDSSHVESETSDTQASVTKEATCSEAGEAVYTVAFENPAFEAQSKTAEVAPLDHAPGEAVREHEVAATCEESGSYEAVIRCTVCDAEISRETERIDALGHDWDEGKVTVEPTSTIEGVRTYTCKRDATHTRTEPISKLDPSDVLTEPAFRTHSLVLDGAIGVNFFMELPELEGVDYTKSYMEFAVSGRGAKGTIDSYDAEYKSTDGRYLGFTCYVSSIQMADTITATFHYKEGEVDKTISQDYSIARYVAAFDERLAADPEAFDADMVKLVHALADYGHYAQPYLSARNGWAIGTDYAEMPGESEFNDETVAKAREACQPYASSYDFPEGGEVSNIAMGLNLTSDTTVYLVVKTTDGAAVESATLAGGGDLRVRKTSDGSWRVYIPGVMAHELGDTFEVTITTSGGTEAHVRVSAVSFVQAVFASPSHEGDANARNIATGLWRYWEAADAYAQAHPDE